MKRSVLPSTLTKRPSRASARIHLSPDSKRKIVASLQKKSVLISTAALVEKARRNGRGSRSQGSDESVDPGLLDHSGDLCRGRVANCGPACRWTEASRRAWQTGRSEGRHVVSRAARARQYRN